MNEEQKAQVAELMHGPKRKRGRPAGTPKPSTFEEAMAELRPAEATFVRHVLAGKDQREAYALTHPKSTAPKGQQVRGSLLATRARVKHALALGRKAGAIQAISGIKYDVQTAHEELCDRIEAAHKEGQHSAVAQLMKLKMTLHKLDQPQAQQQQGIQIVLQTADGAVVRSFGGTPQPVINIEGEEVQQ